MELQEEKDTDLIHLQIERPTIPLNRRRMPTVDKSSFSGRVELETVEPPAVEPVGSDTVLMPLFSPMRSNRGFFLDSEEENSAQTAITSPIVDNKQNLSPVNSDLNLLASARNSITRSTTKELSLRFKKNEKKQEELPKSQPEQTSTPKTPQSDISRSISSSMKNEKPSGNSARFSMPIFSQKFKKSEDSNYRVSMPQFAAQKFKKNESPPPRFGKNEEEKPDLISSPREQLSSQNKEAQYQGVSSPGNLPKTVSPTRALSPLNGKKEILNRRKEVSAGSQQPTLLNLGSNVSKELPSLKPVTVPSANPVISYQRNLISSPTIESKKQVSSPKTPTGQHKKPVVGNLISNTSIDSKKELSSPPSKKPNDPLLIAQRKSVSNSVNPGIKKELVFPRSPSPQNDQGKSMNGLQESNPTRGLQDNLQIQRSIPTSPQSLTSISYGDTRKQLNSRESEQNEDEPSFQGDSTLSNHQQSFYVKDLAYNFRKKEDASKPEPSQSQLVFTKPNEKSYLSHKPRSIKNISPQNNSKRLLLRSPSSPSISALQQSPKTSHLRKTPSVSNKLEDERSAKAATLERKKVPTRLVSSPSTPAGSTQLADTKANGNLSSGSGSFRQSFSLKEFSVRETKKRFETQVIKPNEKERITSMSLKGFSFKSSFAKYNQTVMKKNDE